MKIHHFIAALVCAGAACSLQAGPYTILGGTAYSDRNSASFNVFGSNFQASGGNGKPLFVQQTGPPCPTAQDLCSAPGTYHFVDSTYASNGQDPGPFFSGSLTLDGTTYFFSSTTCGGEMFFSGFLTLPDLGSTLPQTLVVTAPFTASGSFGFATLGLPNIQFQGSGIATITMDKSPGCPACYVGSSTSYTFIATPEPSAIGLVGLGLALLAASRFVKF